MATGIRHETGLTTEGQKALMDSIVEKAADMHPNHMERTRPATAYAILENYLTKRLSVKKFLLKHKVSRPSYYACVARHNLAMEKREQEVRVQLEAQAEAMNDVMWKKIGQLQDDEKQLNYTPLRDIDTAARGLFDRRQLLDGKPTVITGKERKATVEDAKEYLDSILSEAKVVEAEVVET